jgi:predicted metal-dependent hydrolase
MNGMVSALLRNQTAYAAGDVIDCGDYRLRLKVNTRSRRISLRIDNKTGDAVVTAPKPRQLVEAVEFARSRHDWILKSRRGQSQPQPFAPGLKLSIKGHEVTLEARDGVITPKAEQQADGSWHLVTSGDGPTYARRIERYLRQQAMKTFEAETTKYVAMLGHSGVKVSLFDAKARWGSCTPARKAIRYSWRVILAPKAVLSYLCAHEVAHLKHPDHSPAFWAQVTALYGAPYKPARDWLKKQGHLLFTYQ